MRVMHFVTGGFSGATQVAVDLCLAARSAGMDVVLVLRRKRRTTLPAKVEALRAQGLDVRVVPGWAHAATVWALRALALEWRPDILVAHGYSEHLWGRYAGLLARVPRLVHVEHNSRERYTAWRLRQALWLAERTDLIVGVSEGVRQSLLARGFPAAKTVAIPNGIALGPYELARHPAWADRVPGIVMAARFARQKDHATLIQALALLRDRGLTPRLDLAGAGSARLLKPIGIHLPTYPVKVYSASTTIQEYELAPQLSVFDSTYRVALTRLGKRLRIAGCAELGSSNFDLHQKAIDTLVKVGDDWFPSAANYRTASFWCGPTAMLPEGVPLIGATRYGNVFVNAGHGAGAWALAAGSGKLVADLVSGRSPDIDTEGLTLNRYADRSH